MHCYRVSVTEMVPMSRTFVVEARNREAAIDAAERCCGLGPWEKGDPVSQEVYILEELS